MGAPEPTNRELAGIHGEKSTKPSGGIPFLPVALALLVAASLIQIGWGERLPVNMGLGWDGALYARFARDLPTELSEGRIDAFHLRRILPSALVHAGLRLTGQPMSVFQIRQGFEILNALLLVGTLLCWAGIAGNLGISRRGKWLGFCLLFLNVPNLKLAFYYPVLTDTSALALGAWLILAHLRGNRLWLLTATLLGAFTWPLMLLWGLLLYLFPREALAPGDSASRRATILAGLASAGYLGLTLWILRGEPDPRDVRVAYWNVLWLSLPLILAYVFLVSRSLLGSDALVRRDTWLASFSWGRLAVAGLLALCVTLASQLTNTPASWEARDQLDNVVRYAVGLPAIHLISHAVYFGGVFFLVVLYWKGVVRAAHGLGLGITIYFALHLALAVTSESRRILDALPLLVTLAVLAVDHFGWSASRIWGIAALGLFASKIWLPINQSSWGLEPGPMSLEQTSAVPAQLYFMNMGPWMSLPFYLIQGAAVLIIGVGLWLFLSKAPRGYRS